MSDPKIKIKIGTEADTKSIKQLEDELKKLQKELKELPTGSRQFADLAGRVKTAGLELREAESAAKKLGVTVGRQGNAGMAVLEFSRAFEDAQYGIRGVLNNIPGLIAMLGGGAGLAGVISIAAVAATQLWERMADTKKAEDNTSKFVKDTTKILGELKKALLEVAIEQGKLGGDSFEKAFKARKVAVDAEKTAMDNYITTLTTAIEQEGKLAKLQTAAALRKVDQQQREGTITPEEGNSKRLDIQIGAVKGDEARARELIGLENKKAETQVKAAVTAYQIAADELTLGRGRLTAQQTEAESIKKQIQLRTNLDRQRDGLQAQVDKAGTLSPRDAINQTGKRLGLDPSDPQEFERIQEAIRKEGDDLAEAIRKINQRIANEAPQPVASIQKKNADGSDGELLKPSIIKRAEALEKGDDTKGIKSLDTLSADVVSLTEKANAAAGAITKANTALGQQAVTAQQKMVDVQINAISNPALQEVERKAGEAARDLMEAILVRIPDAAKGPEVTAAVEKIGQITKDGVQKDEVDESQQLLAQLQAKLDQGDSQRAVLFQKIITNTDAVISALSGVSNKLATQSTQISEINRTITGIKIAAKPTHE